ncbi:DUF5798 family protein [Halorarum halobium]|uniref:DUF5798 family protein n=1 Tax=Halorarum halobium TaxID=3075121 RepID=UPI0028AEEC0D|nr:DUF5798 family protein [Halobaculum sp. XH14]
MGLGSTAKKIQTVADTAEKLYARVNEMREEVDRMRDTVSTTEQRVERVEGELAEQRALVVALAEERGIDPDAVVEEVAATDESSADDAASDDAGTESDGSAA